jgi:hypothetical protein
MHWGDFCENARVFQLRASARSTPNSQRVIVAIVRMAESVARKNADARVQRARRRAPAIVG